MLGGVGRLTWTSRRVGVEKDEQKRGAPVSCSVSRAMPGFSSIEPETLSMSGDSELSSG